MKAEYPRIGELIDICKRHNLDGSDIKVVLNEPYIPYIPKNWNKVLVLAESQNLSTVSSNGYVEGLLAKSQEERFLRQYQEINPEDVGVQPWDDCSIKLAIEAALGAKADDTGISNAVVWSQISQTGTNVNPSLELSEKSAAFWREMLSVLEPVRIVACGKIAQYVMQKAEFEGVIPLRLPSPNAMSRISGMFPDIIKRYPIVQQVIDAHPEWAHQLNKYRQNKIFFACHAISIVEDMKHRGVYI